MRGGNGMKETRFGIVMRKMCECEEGNTVMRCNVFYYKKNKGYIIIKESNQKRKQGIVNI